MIYCEKCKEHKHTPGPCLCEPFNITCEDGDDYTIYANSEWLAALQYAKESNECNDYYLMDESVEITVNGNKYNITATPDIHYSATEIK